MATYVVTVEDSITFRRTVEITIKARSQEEAEEKALDRADEEMSSDNATITEEQIDNTPYEVIAILKTNQRRLSE